MNISHLKSLSEQDRKAVLESESIAVEEGTYEKPLDEEEVSYYKDMLAAKSIDEQNVNEEFAEIKDKFKEQLSEIKLVKDRCIHAVKHKSIPCEGRRYLIPDYDGGMIYVVDAAGNVITSRRMRNEEKQYRIQAHAG